MEEGENRIAVWQNDNNFMTWTPLTSRRQYRGETGLSQHSSLSFQLINDSCVHCLKCKNQLCTKFKPAFLIIQMLLVLVFKAFWMTKIYLIIFSTDLCNFSLDYLYILVVPVLLLHVHLNFVSVIFSGKLVGTCTFFIQSVKITKKNQIN